MEAIPAQDAVPLETPHEPPSTNGAATAEKPVEVEAAGSAKKKAVRKKKKPKDALAPKMPLSGYNFFMRESRPSILERNPDASIQEITRKVALEWGSLTEEQRRPFLQSAEREKSRYLIEIAEYRKTKASEEAAANQSIEKASPVPSKKAKPENVETKEIPIAEEPKVGAVAAPLLLNGNRSNGLPSQSFSELFKRRTGDYDIPIFTEEFLEYNKTLDSELRTLRKSQTDYEQQNSILEKHVENMQNGVDKLTGETASLREQNAILTNYLTKLRGKLVDCFSSLAIPTESNGASPENIDKYMADLQNMATSNSHGPASLNKARDILRKTDLIQLQ